jgi:tryptophanyl-tRNA synthetase
MRVLSGIKPSGSIHLGNYLGAIRNWVAEQHRDTFYGVVDLHALTLPIEPDELRRQTLTTAATLLASGIEPDRSTLFVQSWIPFHARLSWLLECVVSFGELRRMTQFKEKGGEQAGHRAGLFTYPVLMASDILLYDTDAVPVGEDQRQHLELTRVIAERFNARYGETFVVPDAIVPTAGARVMDLQEPTRKMSKSELSPQGTISLTDAPADIERKIKRAVTDTDNEVRFDRKKKPGVSNLLEILAAIEGADPKVLASRYTRYGDLKSDVAAAVVATLEPIQVRYNELLADPGELHRLMSIGSQRANEVAGPVFERASDAIGLLRSLP